MRPSALDMQKRELLVGDVVCLLCFCFYKQVSPHARKAAASAQGVCCMTSHTAQQRAARRMHAHGLSLIARVPLLQHGRVPWQQIAAIMLAPAFPGVLAPMRFNPVRFEEFAGFAVTLCGTWVGTALLLGAYNRDSTSGSTLPGPTILESRCGHMRAWM